MIHLVIGPMFSGKTTKLLNLYREKGGIILDYSETNHKTGFIVNHDGQKEKCIHISCLEDVVLIEDSIIYINEAQFFPDLLSFVKKWEIKGKEIYIFGLDGDFLRNPMGQILQVIPLCDTIEKRRGKCAKCEKASLFSKRITNDLNPYLLDETAYIPVCRNCYLMYNEKV